MLTNGRITMRNNQNANKEDDGQTKWDGLMVKQFEISKAKAKVCRGLLKNTIQKQIL